MMELVDMLGLGSSSVIGVGVQVPFLVMTTINQLCKKKVRKKKEL